MSSEFILIENSAQMEFYLRNYRSRFIPIIYEAQCLAILEDLDLPFLSINHELQYREIVNLFSRSTQICRTILTKLDHINQGLLREIFSVSEFRLFEASSKYLLSYVLGPNVYHVMVGLSRILRRFAPCSLFFFPLEIDKEIFSKRLANDYFCPNRIVPFFLSVLDSAESKCIRLEAQVGSHPQTWNRATRRDNLKQGVYWLADKLIFGRKLRQLELGLGRSLRSILVIHSNHGLSAVMDQLQPFQMLRRLLGDCYSVLSSTVGDSIRHEGLIRLPRNKRRSVSSSNNSARLVPIDFAFFDGDEFSRTTDGELETEIAKRLSVIPIRFMEANISSMRVAWEGIRELDRHYSFDALLWDCPPASDPERVIISEYFRAVGKPRIGVQHGGAYASKRYGYAHFDLDYDNCEYYFGYGYSDNDLRIAFPERKVRPIIFSPLRENVELKLENTAVKLKEGRRFKVVYVVCSSGHFFGLARPNRIDQYLYNFQRRIVQRLARFNPENILIQFAPREYRKHPLYTTMASLPVSFEISEAAWIQVMQNYKMDYILMDVISTPLEQSILLPVQFLLFDNLCGPLTAEARTLLLKRAVVTSDEEEYLGYIDAIFRGEFPTKDVLNRQYSDRYSTQPFGSNIAGLQRIFDILKLHPTKKEGILQSQASGH